MVEFIKTFLPAFMLMYIGTIYLWNFRRNQKSTIYKQNHLNAKVKKAGRIFHVLLLIATLIVMLFSYFPQYYNYLLPFDLLDIPALNNFGILLLKICLVITVVIQIDIDRWLKKISLSHFSQSINVEKQTITRNKTLYAVMVLIFVGIFVTISSLAAAIIAIMSIIYYLFEFRHKSKKLNQ